MLLCVASNTSAPPRFPYRYVTVIIRVPERESKLFSKFVGPRLVTHHLGGHELEVWGPCSRYSEIVHADRLKRTSAEPEEGEPPPVEISETGTTPRFALASPHTCNLRSRQ